MKKITIIGGGNLGCSIAEGLLKSQFCTTNELAITKRNTATLEEFKERGVCVTSNNKEAIINTEWIILAVKPYQLEDIAKEIRPYLNEKHRLISVVSGISLSELQRLFQLEKAIIRAMPNTAIAILESMTCLCFNDISTADKEFTIHLFNHLGKTIVLEEALMDAATVLAACGIAYAMRFIRSNTQGGIEIGFSAQNASLIAAQTIKGAAQLLLESNTHPEQEIDKVTTPKGCTITGLNEMEHHGFSSALIKGIVTSFEKIKSN